MIPAPEQVHIRKLSPDIEIGIGTKADIATGTAGTGAAGWKAPVTEIEYLCFADLTSWPKSKRSR